MTECWQANLHSSWIVEARVCAEVNVESLSQWCEALNALRALVERLCARDQQVEPREVSRIDLVDPLAKCVQAPLASVCTHALQGLDLVQHEQQATVTRVAQHRQQSGEKIGRAKVIDVSLDAGSPF